MNYSKTFSFLLVFFTQPLLYAQNIETTTTKDQFIREVYTQALTEGKAYEDLRFLCKEIGARITGSTEAQMAIEWGKEKMTVYGLDVKLHEIQVPHWERGTKEAFYFKTSNGTHVKLRGLALGGSIGTNGTLRGDLIEFSSLDALKSAPSEMVTGKIVFVNHGREANTNL